MGSLLAHEVRVNRSYKKVEEKAFQVKGESPYKANQIVQVLKAKVGVAIISNVEVLVEAKVSLEMNASLRAIFNVKIVKNLEKRKQNAKANGEMTQRKLTLQRNLWRRVMCSRFTLPLAGTQ